MTTHPTRRSILSALGFALPTGLAAAASAAPVTTATQTGPDLVLRFRPFEQAVREAFANRPKTPTTRRIEIGHSDLTRAGLQGCHNAKPFAGFPAGHLRITHTGTEPGPILNGVRLYIATVDLAWTGGQNSSEEPSRPLDFHTLPPAPRFA